MAPSEFSSKSDLITAIFIKYKYNMRKIVCDILGDSPYVEDVISDAMIKIIKNINMIDDIETKKSANFIYTITKNTALDFYRKKAKENKKICTVDWVDNIKETLEYDIFESKYGFGEQICSYIEMLESIDIDIIGLKYGNEFSYKEIGLMLDMSEDNVRQRASRARQKLKKIITEEK